LALKKKKGIWIPNQVGDDSGCVFGNDSGVVFVYNSGCAFEDDSGGYSCDLFVIPAKAGTYLPLFLYGADLCVYPDGNHLDMTGEHTGTPLQNLD